jgi:hypothetical protein
MALRTEWLDFMQYIKDKRQKYGTQLYSLTEANGMILHTLSKKKLNSVALVRERTIPTKRPQLVNEVRANVSDRGCRVVSTKDPYGRILGFLDQNSQPGLQGTRYKHSNGMNGWEDKLHCTYTTFTAVQNCFIPTWTALEHWVAQHTWSKCENQYKNAKSLAVTMWKNKRDWFHHNRIWRGYSWHN